MKPDVMQTVAPRIIIALDYDNVESALRLVESLSPTDCGLKVGKELFTAAGPVFVEMLVRRGFFVFLDLKYHDIPNTVAKACKAAANLGVGMITVHALGGLTMLEAARAAIDTVAGKHPLLIAVTLLTSMTPADLTLLGMTDPLENRVLNLACLSQQAGLDGVVCSVQEASQIRTACGEKFIIVTPGIRPPMYEIPDDQQRTSTPREAIIAGSHYLVIGRPVTQANIPPRVLQDIINSIKDLN